MEDKKAKRYLDMQLDELKEMVGVEIEKDEAYRQRKSGQPEDLEIATLYADAAEYEAELVRFEQELEILKANDVKALTTAMAERFADEAQNYAQELKAVVETGWKQLVEVARTHPAEQLMLIRETDFESIPEKLAGAFPGYEGDFEAEIKGMLLQRWAMYIEVKKEHIKEEIGYIKALGLKPHYAKKVYKRYHGIE